MEKKDSQTFQENVILRNTFQMENFVKVNTELSQFPKFLVTKQTRRECEMMQVKGRKEMFIRMVKIEFIYMDKLGWKSLSSCYADNIKKL